MKTYILTIKRRKNDGSRFVFSKSTDRELLQSRANINNNQMFNKEEYIVEEKDMELFLVSECEITSIDVVDFYWNKKEEYWSCIQDNGNELKVVKDAFPTLSFEETKQKWLNSVSVDIGEAYALLRDMRNKYDYIARMEKEND